MLLQLRRDFVLKGRGPKRRHFFLGKKIDLLSRLSRPIWGFALHWLDAFIFCHEEFRAILLKNKDQVSKSPLDQSISEFLERSVKAFDICNASRNGIEKIHTWLKHVEIVLCSLGSNQRAFKEGQFLRARKALMDLALAMVDGKESGSAFSHRNRSFGRNGTSKDHHCQSKGHSWSHSWSVSPSWSAAKQLQSIASNLVPPGANEIIATRGMAVPMYAMNSVLLFVLIDGLQPLEHQVKKAFRKIMTCRIEMLDLLGT
ncbi:hypothetical protein Ahy_B10g101325 [Arachis hypogaea]|uniref:Uncharacterized protein n=1 Tax=Arachis hypogaea TaxID=3818 RepID=A0A444WZA8_ARAHY|nr:hypothetical protein Ahy_B10g101325 [Arachis hypogaea]